MLIAITRSDGGVTALHVMHRQEAEREVGRWAEANKYRWDLVSWREIQPEDVPPDRDYRAALMDEGHGALKYNMVRARTVYRDRIRARRAELFAQLDNDRRDAEDSDDAVALALVRVRRRFLKDAPADPRIDACQTVEELRTLDVLDDVDSANSTVRRTQ